FAFVQFEFGFLLGPPDGRYVSRPGSADDEPEHVIVLRTQGAPQRGVFRGRVPRRRGEGEVEAVPTARVSVVRAEPFGSREEADAWLGGLRGEKGSLEDEAARSNSPARSSSCAPAPTSTQAAPARRRSRRGSPSRQ